MYIVSKKIVILGSTGSVGTQCLEIIRNFPDDFSVLGLSAGKNFKLLKEQVQEFSPKYFFIENYDQNIEEAKKISLEEMVTLEDVDLVVMALSGSIGLVPVHEAVNSGKTIILANKESMVMAGKMLVEKAKLTGATILPVDSEPSAIWQCMMGERKNISKLILTASGGSLRNYSINELKNISPELVLKHPTWNMGAKITVDSATLLNKAFEVIESSNLFSVPLNNIDVLIHPESIVHSLVEFIDGNLKALLSIPDMRFPIQYAMFFPDRKANVELPECNLAELGSLNFSPVIPGKYPLFDMAMSIAQNNNSLMSVLVGADEAVVDLFINGKIKFLDMNYLIEKTIQSHQSIKNPSLEDIKNASEWGFNNVHQLIDI
ncbi:MAG: 1-deoxy-D-xylulose-5-phosphate reductoisomerase [Chloroflexi bacterium]|nr:1-deoxy-D-xylulose-5-phosphate reductoisomerase [Chloroflexota bacterium]